MRHALLYSIFAGLAPSLAACVGSLEGPPAPGNISTHRCEPELAAESGLPHLTRGEYDRAVRALLAPVVLEERPSRDLPADDGVAGFAVGATVSSAHVEGWVEAAERIATTAASSPSLVRCDLAHDAETSCLLPFVDGLGRRAFRRPLRPQEREQLASLYRATLRADGEIFALEALIASLLASPHFLYHTELAAPVGGAAGESELEDHALATRMAFLLWGAPPDDALLDAAGSGALGEPEGRETIAREMLADPRAREGLRELVSQWLGLARLDAVRRDGLAIDGGERLRRSAEAFIDAVLFEEDGRLETLLTASWTIADGPVAELLDVPGPMGDVLSRVELDPAERAGLLTHPALLSLNAQASSSDPIRRGVWVLDRLLCDDLPTPPAGITPPEPSAGATTRERFAAHTAQAACRGCHERIDPIGFGFERYDQLGRHRTEEAGRPIDAHGAVIAGMGDASGEFDGAVELAHRLGTSAHVEACFATQAYRFAYGRRELGDEDCALAALASRFRRSGGDVRELAIALVTSDAFRTRRVDTLDPEGVDR